MGQLPLVDQRPGHGLRGRQLSGHGSAADDAWISRLSELRATALPGGTLDHVTAAARLRGAAAVRSGTCINLARAMDPAADSPPRYSLTTRFEERGRLTVGFDDLEVSQHGVHHTHLDAWSHYGIDGTFFPGVGTDRPEEAGVDPWAARGVVTRAVLLDVTAVRGTGWVDPADPVHGEELQAALDLTGDRIHPGDALLVHLGRDRFEASGERYRTIPDTIASGLPRAGLGTSAAEWIASRPVSLVCWDFLDAVHPEQPHGPVHLLIWAIGLGLVDNCRLGTAVDTMRAEGRHDGLLTVAPLLLPGATASVVSPLLVL